MVALGQPGTPAPDAGGSPGVSPRNASHSVGAPEVPLEALAASGRALAEGVTLVETLEAIARAAADAAGASVAVVRVLEGDGGLRARGLVGESAAVAAEPQGSP